MSGTPRPLAALHYFATDQSLPVADFARAAAELGFDAVLLPEHTHIPGLHQGRPTRAAAACRSATGGRSTRTSRCPSSPRRPT